MDSAARTQIAANQRKFSIRMRVGFTFRPSLSSSPGELNPRISPPNSQRAQRKPGSEDPASDQGRKSSGLLRRGDSGISGINEFPFVHQRRSRWCRRALRLNCTIRVEQEHQSGAARVERATGPDADAGTLEAWRWRAGWPHLRSPEGKIPGNASPAATSPSWPTPAGASSPPAPRSC